MIRIKNVSRENRMARHRETGVLLPGGRYAHTRPNKEMLIDLQTYKLNRLHIVLPGEPINAHTYYRVISGADEIMGTPKQMPELHNESVPVEAMENPKVEMASTPPDTIEAPPITPAEEQAREVQAKENEAANDEIVIEPEEEVSTMEPKENKEPDALAEETSGDELDDPDPEVDDDEPEVEEEAPPEPEDAEKKLYTAEQLEQMVHAQLNDLLAKHHIKLPGNVNKSVKIDALLKING